VTGLEPASFEVERFELARDSCLEVHGRWYGVRGRRFMRPTLTAVAGGREQRLLAVLDHKPWVAEDGEAWLAAFPFSSDPASLLQAELTVAPDVTVPLPRPSSPARGRRRRDGSRSSPVEKTDADSALQVERDAALRSRDEALSGLEVVKRYCERLRDQLGDALAAREAVIAERHAVIEAEVGLRIANLRAEAERERAAAGLAAQIARERDRARAERLEAIRERDEAHAERDTARRERNRMLADRDTARTRAAAATRQWEATAALGTRRTRERDAVASERDRLARERAAIADERDRLARERDAVASERDAVASERDAVASERDAALEQRDRTAHDRGSVLEQRERAVGEETLALAGPSTPISASAHAARRPRRPPAPAETRGRGSKPGSTPQSVKPRDASGMWRARLLAIAALLMALGVLIVTLSAK
jgi:hypothetical protein